MYAAKGKPRRDACVAFVQQALVMTHTMAVAHHDPDGSTSSRPLGRQMYISQLSAATRQVGAVAGQVAAGQPARWATRGPCRAGI
jgi:hypothetical protein